MQEFSSQFAPAPNVRVSAPRITQSNVAATSTSRPLTVPSPAPIIATQQVVKTWEAKDQKDRELIGTIEGAGGLVMMPLMLDMGTALLSKILTLNGLIKGPWAAGVNGLLRAPMRAMRDTELRDWKNFGTRVNAKRVEFNTREGVVNTKLNAKFAAKEANLLKEKPDIKLSGLGNWFERQMTKLTSGGPLKWADDKVRDFANWRHKRLLKSAHNHLAGLSETVSNVPEKTQVGWLGKLLGRTPKEYGVNYGSTGSKIGQLSGITNAAELESAIHSSIDDVRGIARNTVGSHNHQHIFQVRQTLRQGATSATGAAGWKAIGEEGGSAIAKAMRALPKGLGKASLLHVAFGAGAALLVAAKFMDGNRTNRLEGNLINEFAADIYGVRPEQVTKEMVTGTNAHPLVKHVAEAARKAKNGRGVHNALHASFEVANVATLKGLGAGGMLLLPWYGMPGPGGGITGLEQISQNLLIGENSALLAYQELCNAEKGQAQLEKGDIEKRVGVLIASIPGIADAHHGADNRLVQPMAQALVAQGLSAKEMLKAIATPEKMVALAKTAQEQLDAKAAEAKAAKSAEPEHTAGKFTDKIQSRGHASSHAAAIEAEHAEAATKTTKRG